MTLTMNTTMPATKTLAESTRRPDKAEFTREALAHVDTLYGVAMKLTRDPNAAEDLVQDAVLKAYQNWHQFSQGTNCRAWLLRILKNTFINGYRRKTKEREILDSEQAGDYGDRFFARDQARRWSCPETGYHDRHLSPVVEHALLGLRAEYREVVELSDLAGLAYKEIAERLAIPIGTVMSRLFRARRALRELLEDHAMQYGIAVAA